jgi:uncharacterized protein YbjT (DUF2867 family)
MVYTYVSGMNTDSSEKGKVMWARVKGKTENHLMKLGFKKAYAIRPGMIIPVKGVVPSSKLYRILITTLGWVFPIMKAVSPNSIVDSDQIGKAMIALIDSDFSSRIIDPVHILGLSK